MKARRGTRWRVDWRGGAAPEAGQLVRHVTPTGRCGYFRVTSVRVVRNRNQLPEGCECRYAIGVDRLGDKPAGEAVAWTCHAYARRPKSLETDRWSPLL